MTYNSSILPEVLRARSLTNGQLSERLGIKREALERELQRKPEPKQGLLNDIANELALPSFVFFMQKAPPLHDIVPDFRSTTPAPSAKSRATIETIQFAASVQRAVADLKAPAAAAVLPHFEVTQASVIEQFAFQARSFFGITLEDQLEAQDARVFYNICRKKIEDKGVFVLHDSFPEIDGSGFCLSHARHPVVVVNTKKQTRGRRLFTLVHELAHVLMGKTGISDPFITHNTVEKLCNKFAASFLVPDSYASALLGNATLEKDPGLEDVAWAARRLKISQQATVLRLEQLGLFKAGSHEKWKKAVSKNGNPDFGEKGGGAAGPPPQEKVKLAKYGFRFAVIFDQLLRQGRTSEVDIYRISGLKPKFRKKYFEYAQSISADELQELEFDDE